MLYIAWEFFVMLFNGLVILSSVAQNNTICHVGHMLFSCRHSVQHTVSTICDQSVYSFYNYHDIWILTSLTVFAWHKFNSLEKTVIRIPKISLGFIVICFVDLGSPSLSCSWLPDLFAIGTLWKCHLMENASSVSCE